MKKAITVKNTFYHDEMKVKKISRPLKIYYNVHGEPYINYRKTRYYLHDIFRLDYPYINDNIKLTGYNASYYFPFYIQLISGYDPKIVLYEKIYQPDTIA